jgi:hypothetical protein
MRVEHLADGVDLWLGDCRDILPTLGKVDAVVTDPPYGIDYGRSGGFSASHGWGQWRENVAWDAERPDPAVFEQMLAMSKAQIVWGGNYFTDFSRRPCSGLSGIRGSATSRLPTASSLGRLKWKAARIFSLPRGKAAQDGKEHPTQKPVEVMAWCLDFLPDAAPFSTRSWAPAPRASPAPSAASSSSASSASQNISTSPFAASLTPWRVRTCSPRPAFSTSQSRRCCCDPHRPLRYVRHADLDAFMRRGWMVVADLGPQHGQYAVLCWRCECPE